MLYAYVDETDDRGLLGKPGSSPIFGMSIVLATESSAAALRDVVRQLSKDFNVPDENEYVRKSISEVEYIERLDQRRKYRLTPKGKVDPDGFQRFLRPDASDFVVFDKITHKPLKLRWKKTVTIPPSPEAQRLQHYCQYGTPEWQKRYSLRNVVEASNSGLKSLRTELANPVKRAGNGFAYHDLKSAVAYVAENLHRIVAFLRDSYKSANRKLNGPSIRKRRRKDQMTGLPLERPGCADEAESPPDCADDPRPNS